MKLKELALCVHRTLDANKDKWGLVACEPQYLLTYDEAEKQFAWAGEIDEAEVERLNETFWEAGIQTRDFMEVARAIAIILEARCVTKEDRDGKLEWLSSLNEKTAKTVRRINRREPPNEKKHEREWRFGEFSKIEFIQRYGYMYDSEDEANADANDRNATCPVLMGLLNAGWLNFEAKETDGKIIVRARDPKCSFSPSSMLAAIKIAFETMVERHHYKAVKATIHASSILHSLKKEINLAWLNGRTYANSDMKPSELYPALELILNDGDRYPQSVYDFKTLHSDFLKMVRNATNIIANLDETQHDIARQLFVNLLDGMKQLSDVECLLAKRQQERDPKTNRFIYPKYDVSNNIYTMTIGTVIHFLERQYDTVNRMDLTALQTWRNQPENKDQWHPLYSWNESNMIRKYIKAQYYAAGEKPPMRQHTEVKWTPEGYVTETTEVPIFAEDC